MSGTMGTTFLRDFNVLMHELARVKFLAQRGKIADAKSVMATCSTNLATLKASIDAATKVANYPTDTVLPDPILHPLP